MAYCFRIDPIEHNLISLSRFARRRQPVFARYVLSSLEQNAPLKFPFMEARRG